MFHIYIYIYTYIYIYIYISFFFNFFALVRVLGLSNILSKLKLVIALRGLKQVSKFVEAQTKRNDP